MVYIPLKQPNRTLLTTKLLPSSLLKFHYLLLSRNFKNLFIRISDIFVKKKYIVFIKPCHIKATENRRPAWLIYSFMSLKSTRNPQKLWNYKLCFFCYENIIYNSFEHTYITRILWFCCTQNIPEMLHNCILRETSK